MERRSSGEYGVSDALPEQYASYIGLEMEAEEIWQWETQVIPPSRVDARVETRLARQAVLTREMPLRLSVVLDEALLLRRYGDSAVMAEQLRRLQELSGVWRVNDNGVSSRSPTKSSPAWHPTVG